MPHPARLPRRLRGGVIFNGQTAYSMAMHIHSPFSEYTASMDTHLNQATQNAVDIVWWTDHAEHMDYIWCPSVLHFTGLSEKYPAGAGRKPWRWEKHESGANSSSSGGGIVTTPCSPNDPVVGGALSVTAASTSQELAEYGYQAEGTGWHGNLSGLSLLIDVMLEPGWSLGYLEICLPTSYHPAAGGNPAGEYTLSYQVVPSGSQTWTAQGTTGIVTIPAVADGQTWTTVTITPAQDIATLWPDLDSGDFAFYGLDLYAVPAGDLVAGYFDYLRFEQAMNGGDLFTQQAAMMQPLASEYPAVTQQQGLEISLGLPHINWFGGSPSVPAFDGLTLKTYPAWVEQQGIPAIHQAGGLCSWNHPFGTTWQKGVLAPAEQDTRLAQVAGQLLSAGLYGCDILEVGYPERAGVDLAHHLALWDIMSSNAVFVTGNGASDDHWGDDWAGLTWNWTTSALAASTAQSDLLAALAAGEVFAGSLSGFAPSQGAFLNLNLDGECPMGSVSLSGLPSRLLTLSAVGIPAGGQVQVLQGPVSYAGATAPGMSVVAAYSDVEMAGTGGQATVPVDTSSESFMRSVVLDSSGNVQGASNPVWALQNVPPNGIPAPRQV